MTFAFNPDDRPARIMRYVEFGVLPNEYLVAAYDYDTNILTICRQLYDTLTQYEQKKVLRTHHKYLFVSDKGGQLRLAA